MTSHHLESHLFVIFGATGDLTKRKLLPALCKAMPESPPCYIIGAAGSDWTDARFRETAVQWLIQDGIDPTHARSWAERCLYYASLGRTRDDFSRLASRIEALESEHGLPGNRVFYLSVPPRAYGGFIKRLGRCGLHASGGWTRLVIEKPFGRDLTSAQALNSLVHRYFREEQIYRIDHYLGKETVQNLLAFRFANILFESVWNRDRIESIEITVAENLGLESRAGYYDRAGALRDMIQNHLTQLFTLIAMEVPSGFNADAIRQEKIKVLRSVQPLDPACDVVFGQYAAGSMGGKAVRGYLEEEGVARSSRTETFVSARLRVENWRWQGVPFILRTGKRLPRRLTQIAVRFHCAPVALFQEHGSTCGISPNMLLVTLQPNEGFDLRFDVKTPGNAFNLQTQQLSFRYEDTFGTLPEAYETLLLDVMEGDQTLFVHAEEVEASWEVYDALLSGDRPLYPYTAGTWGPKEAMCLHRVRS